jgi:hypothetical protein
VRAIMLDEASDARGCHKGGQIIHGQASLAGNMRE